MKIKKLSFLIVLILCLCLTGCGKSNTKVSKDDTASKTQIDTTAQEEKIKSDDEEEDTPKATFWLNSMDWSKKSPDNIFLYNDKVSVPIKLENLDVCSAPYSYWPNGYNQTNADKIQEILTSTTKITAGSETKISTQEQYINGKWQKLKDNPDNIERINIKNYSESDSTTAECYNKGWWYISNIYDVDDILGIDLTNTGYRRDWDGDLLLDRAIEKLGSPTYVIIALGKSETLKKNEGSIYYYLVYEFDEYAIEIGVMEVINNSQLVKVEGLDYYPKESWEMEKTKSFSKYEIYKK